MEQNPSKANRPSDTSEIPHILWNLKIHYCVHSSQTCIPILSKIHAVCTHPSYSFKICSNIVPPFVKGLPSGATMGLTIRNWTEYSTDYFKVTASSRDKVMMLTLGTSCLTP
jgi:hypothetical protein